MTEEEKKQLEREFQNALDNIISKIKGETATAIVHSEQSMILLFKKIMFKLEKQQKEIEELRKENFDTIYMKAIADYKSKIRKILQIEGNADIETYLKIIVAENNRLEDIEDDRDCNYVSKDKIREKIKQVENGTYDAKIILEKLLEE